MFKVLETFELGESFIQWIKTQYKILSYIYIEMDICHGLSS